MFHNNKIENFEKRAVADLGIEGGGLIYGKPTTLDFAS